MWRGHGGKHDITTLQLPFSIGVALFSVDMS